MTTLKETDIMRPVVEHFSTGIFEQFDPFKEVYVWLGDSQRRIDLIADDQLTLIACEGKAQLDDTVIEQARTLQGVSDATYVVVPDPCRRLNFSQGKVFSERVAQCERLGLGVITVAEGIHVLRREARRNANADTAKLRNACTEPQRDFAEAGSQREGYTPEKAWLQAFERALEEGPIPTSKVRRFVDAKCPHRSTRLAITAIKNAIHDGKVAARLDGVTFIRTE